MRRTKPKADADERRRRFPWRIRIRGRTARRGAGAAPRSAPRAAHAPGPPEGRRDPLSIFAVG